MKRLSLLNRTEVLPALHRHSVRPAASVRKAEPQPTFEQRLTRASRFPVEASLARSPEQPWRGRFLDIEV